MSLAGSTRTYWFFKQCILAFFGRKYILIFIVRTDFSEQVHADIFLEEVCAAFFFIRSTY